MTPRICALLASLLLVTACSSGTTSTPAASAPESTTTVPTAATDPTISIAEMKFTSPAPVAPGATITVINSDSAEHSVTSDAGNTFDADVDGKGTATFTAPSQPGTYAYHCSYHPTMHGQLIVR